MQPTGSPPRSNPPKLQRIVAADQPADNAGISPLLWPLVAYLGVGTTLLFLISQVERLATTILPGSVSPRMWHAGSVGWIAIYPLVLPFLCARVLLILGIAVPLRIVFSIWLFALSLLDLAHGVLRRIHAALRNALSASWARARELFAQVRQAARHALYLVREAANLTVSRVRAVLARLVERT